jgi:hypothetical protein
MLNGLVSKGIGYPCSWSMLGFWVEMGSGGDCNG